jgi:5-methylcytosine-specific restriction protein B
MAENVRHGLLVRTCLEVLREAERPLRPAETAARMAERIGEFTPYERETLSGGRVRWQNTLQWGTGDMATVGWLSKTGGWRITDSGEQALETYPDDEDLQRALIRLRQQVYEERKRAVETLAPFEQQITVALGEVAPGQWTSYQDIAAIAETSPETVASFLASRRVPNAHRVLREDGSPPPEGMLNQWLRGGTGIRAELLREGVDFDGDGRASQEQRVTANELRGHIASFTRAEQESRPQSAWLVRGSVDGDNLVPAWLAGGFVSLAASRLPSGVSTASRETIEAAVKEAYDFKTYAQLDRLVREFNAFLRQIRASDYVTTVDGGRLFIGEITGEAEFTDAPDGRSNLRRAVRWLHPDAPVDYSELGEQFVNLLSDQSHVVNLTDVVDLLQTLATRPHAERTSVSKPEATLAPVTAALAEQLFVHDRAWLQEVADLLAEKRQLVLYGPPGTGKTYLATHLARHLAGGERAVKLVQFHPSYTYEDFFEGYRPRTGTGGQLSFELRPGPLRALADAASEDSQTPYLLVIDEINRANLAKVFGELYFLLEYREESIGLQYSPDDKFSLPRNLFLIGTMNTADRSIALVDTAMRRRFAFVEMHPRDEPVRGLLRRWLDRHGYEDRPARLLAALNQRLADRDYAIGPSYLMKHPVHTRPDGLERVWRTEIMPLLEELHYGEGADLETAYGLAALRRHLSAPVDDELPEPQ